MSELPKTLPKQYTELDMLLEINGKIGDLCRSNNDLSDKISNTNRILVGLMNVIQQNNNTNNTQHRTLENKTISECDSWSHIFPDNSGKCSICNKQIQDLTGGR